VCGPRHIFYGVECVRSRFHLLCVRTLFRRSRGRWAPFSCFAVPSVSGPVFMFCAPGLIFGGNEDVRSRFDVLRSRRRFPRYRGRRVPFSSFTLPGSLLELPRATGLVIMFCVTGLIFYGIEGVGSRFQVLSVRTLFRRYRRRRHSFSCFELPNSFSYGTEAVAPVFKFFAPKLFFGGTAGVESRF
jgi:hypothetical protein